LKRSKSFSRTIDPNPVNWLRPIARAEEAKERRYLALMIFRRKPFLIRPAVFTKFPHMEIRDFVPVEGPVPLILEHLPMALAANISSKRKDQAIGSAIVEITR
jgi:hypothetical protein